MSDTAPQSPTEIIVNGYSPRFVAACGKVLAIEGGFVDDPKDHGGATKYGISLRFLLAEGTFDADHDGRADFDLDLDGDIDVEDIRLLKRSDATALFFRCFWKPLGGDTFPTPVSEMMFDQAINGGLVAARKLLQRAINSSLMLIPASKSRAPMLTIDGDIGDKTRTALRCVIASNSVGMLGLITAYRAAAAERYRSIAWRYPDQKRFLDGWLARADRLGRA